MTDLAHAVTEAEEAVKEAEAKLAEAIAARDHKEFPKWIVPHRSHIDSAGGHITVPYFPDFHIDRDGRVTVQVTDAEYEAKALAAKETA